MLILILVFGTVTAMAMPIVSAIVGLLTGLSIVSLLGHTLAIPDVAPTVATMIGLGVGIDYALFIVTRARSARYEGRSVHDAIGHAAATSGSAVAFAGGTVVIALLALAVSGLSLHHDARPGGRDRGRGRSARVADTAARAARAVRRRHRAAAHRPRPSARRSGHSGCLAALGSAAVAAARHVRLRFRAGPDGAQLRRC